MKKNGKILKNILEKNGRWESDLDWFDAFKEVEYEDKEYIKEMMEMEKI